MSFCLEKRCQCAHSATAIWIGALDAIHRVGTSRIITEPGIRAVNLFSLDTAATSYDTTATNVWGEYVDVDGNPLASEPKLVFGHSKDDHPELKQFMTELLCVDRGVPIFGATLDGDSSDKTSNNRMLTRIGELMKQHGLGKGSFIYVADSAMVSESNLAAAGENLFVSRLPSNYYDCAKLVFETVEKACWTKIGTIAEELGGPRRPAAVYKYAEGKITAAGKEYRAIVVHSDLLDRRRQKKLEKQMAKSTADLRTQLKKCVMEFHCEPDAEAAARQMRG
ncbi:MAG: IS1634 family transposase, partial [Lentisphaeria bacterium]